MSLHEEGFAVLPPDAQHWRESNIMKIPNADLLRDLGGRDRLGGRLWRLPPYSANTWHRHLDSWELYFLLEGVGSMRVGERTIRVPRYGCVLVAPPTLRQIFNDTPAESLWLILAAPGWATTATVDANGTFIIDGAPFFPIGMYHVSWIGDRQGDARQVADFDAIADAGFNLVHPTVDLRPGMAAALDRAAARGLRVIAEIGWSTTAGAGNIINLWKDKPAIIGWNIADDFNAPYSGPPAISCSFLATSGSFPLSVAAAPSSRAAGNLAGSTSTATMRSCPSARSMPIAISPSPPAPSTATHSSRGMGASAETAE